MVFSDLGVELTAENLEDICDQFEIARSTELTFPEVVDIASFESVPYLTMISKNVYRINSIFCLNINIFSYM